MCSSPSSQLTIGKLFARCYVPGRHDCRAEGEMRKEDKYDRKLKLVRPNDVRHVRAARARTIIRMPSHARTPCWALRDHHPYTYI